MYLSVLLWDQGRLTNKLYKCYIITLISLSFYITWMYFFG
jgi:hypothetical protein